MRFRIIPPLETYPSIVEFVQTNVGKICLLFSFAWLLQWVLRPWFDAIVILGATTFWPRHRRRLLALGALYWLITYFLWGIDGIREILLAHGPFISRAFIDVLPVIIPSVGIFLFLTIVLLAQKYPRSWLMRHPIRNLLISHLLILFATYWIRLPWLFYILLCFTLLVLGRGPLVWILGYFLIDINRTPGVPLSSRLGYIPFTINYSLIPIPKGPEYLRTTEAQNDRNTAIIQLKGLKLLIWVNVLHVMNSYASAFLNGPMARFGHSTPVPISLNIPPLWEACLRANTGSALPWQMNWLSLAVNFPTWLLEVAVWNNIPVAMARVAGFDVLRYCYRPLEADSIADFFNRAAYYYKELLSNMFFYPTFFCFFRGQPRVRLAFAILVSVTIGSSLLWYLREADSVIFLGPQGGLRLIQSRIFYALLLGVGVALSRLREERTHSISAEPRSQRPFGTLLGYLCIFGFYALIAVFDDLHDNWPIQYGATFLRRLMPF